MSQEYKVLEGLTVSSRKIAGTAMLKVFNIGLDKALETIVYKIWPQLWVLST